jgi:heme/copper-type cytochrome/quinol oxidase subunit 2
MDPSWFWIIGTAIFVIVCVWFLIAVALANNTNASQDDGAGYFELDHIDDEDERR